MRPLLPSYYSLTKPRITFMVLVTAAWGCLFARPAGIAALLGDGRLWATLLGAALAASGGSVLNNYLERDIDGAMARTRDRALPTGAIRPLHALLFGLCLILLAEGLLIRYVNLLTAFLVLLTNFLYVLVYTPAKRVSALNTTIGAVPGAMPPLIGWAGMQGSLDVGAWVLFAILFVWQHPHVYAIVWTYRDEYAGAGFKMLSRDDDGSLTGLAVVAGIVALVVVASVPAFTGMSRMFYLLSSLAMGGGLVVLAARLASRRSIAASRRLTKAMLLYLPLLLACMLIDSLL